LKGVEYAKLSVCSIIQASTGQILRRKSMKKWRVEEKHLALIYS
jgi:hypothetical protein